MQRRVLSTGRCLKARRDIFNRIFKLEIMIDAINIAIRKGAKVYSNISGGKDGQAMSYVLCQNKIPIEKFLHADLGRVEWKESLEMCMRIAESHKRPLQIVLRKDKKDLLQVWRNRMEKLKGTGKPFWSSPKNRYCTSSMKRDPIDVFYRNCGHDFIISAEGIRADESACRKKKNPLTVRVKTSHSYYRKMTAVEAINNFQPGKRLTLTWYPIFNYSIEEVWQTQGMSSDKLSEARMLYSLTSTVPVWWPFHPAYAYGNDRVSCAICILASENDIHVGAKHNPSLLKEMQEMEIEGNATFKFGWSLNQLDLSGGALQTRPNISRFRSRREKRVGQLTMAFG